MLSRWSFIGGRRGAAALRPDESYVDVYDTRSAILVLVFFGLTVFDAIATVYYIDHVEGSEWNPVADWLLRQGRIFFVLGKGLPTALLLLFVMIHKNYRYGRVALTIGFGFYFLLGIYHVVLQLMAFAHESGWLGGL